MRSGTTTCDGSLQKGLILTWLASLAIFMFWTGAASASSLGVNRWSSHGPDPHVSRLAIDPSRPLVIFAAAGSLFRSGDGGGTWIEVPIDPSRPSIAAIAVDPSNSRILYAGGSSSPTGGAVVYKSSDAGESWVRAGAGLPVFGAVGEIAVAPSRGDTLYALAQNTVYRSTDGGATWTGLSLNVENKQRLAVDPLDASTVYLAAIGGRVPNGGVFKSVDGGTTWTNLPVPLLRAWRIAIDPTRSSVLYSQDWLTTFIARSVDAGNTWAVLEGPPSVGESLVVDPINPTTLYASTDTAGVFKSIDSGQTWTPFNEGLPDPHAGAGGLVMDRFGLSLHFAGLSGSGVFDYQFVSSPLSLQGGRILVSLFLTDQRTGRTEAGYAVSSSDVFGYFSAPAFTGNFGNPEVIVKILDGRPVNGSFWVFYSGLTDLEYTLTITDVVSGASRVYHNPPGSLCGGFDTAAF